MPFYGFFLVVFPYKVCNSFVPLNSPSDEILPPKTSEGYQTAIVFTFWWDFKKVPKISGYMYLTLQFFNDKSTKTTKRVFERESFLRLEKMVNLTWHLLLNSSHSPPETEDSDDSESEEISILFLLVLLQSSATSTLPKLFFTILKHKTLGNGQPTLWCKMLEIADGCSSEIWKPMMLCLSQKSARHLIGCHNMLPQDWWAQRREQIILFAKSRV